jgi:protein SCO1/2
MKKNCLLLLSVILLAQESGGAETCSGEKGHSCCSAGMPPAPALTDKSLYQLTDSWTNDAGQTIKLASIAGRPQIVAMFFANCQYACPLLVYQMQQIEAALPETVRTNVGFVLVSFDTERDSVAALHNYRLQRGLDLKRWTLLRGSSDSVLDLAALLGVQFKKDGRGQFLHSNLITLLNSQGEIAYQKTGLTLESQPMVERVEGLAAR